MRPTRTNRVSKRILVVVGCVAGLAAVACTRTEDAPAAPVRLTAADLSASPNAGLETVDLRPELRLADALCRREAACGRLGPLAAYADVPACIRGTGAYVGEQLRGWSCSPGGARGRLRDCLASIASEPCTTILDRADRVPTCRANVICGR